MQLIEMLLHIILKDADRFCALQKTWEGTVKVKVRIIVQLQTMRQLQLQTVFV